MSHLDGHRVRSTPSAMRVPAVRANDDHVAVSISTSRRSARICRGSGVTAGERLGDGVPGCAIPLACRRRSAPPLRSVRARDAPSRYEGYGGRFAEDRAILVHAFRADAAVPPRPRRPAARPSRGARSVGDVLPEGATPGSLDGMMPGRVLTTTVGYGLDPSRSDSPVLDAVEGEDVRPGG